MAYDVAFVVVIVGLIFVGSLSSSPTDIPKEDRLCKKCPPGYSALCPPYEESRCVSCVTGVTYSKHHSRSTSCRPCSTCPHHQFEMAPCTTTSDVVCQKCSGCHPGFGVRSLCARSSDTVCEVCPNGSVSDEYSLVKSCQPCDMCGSVANSTAEGGNGGEKPPAAVDPLLFEPREQSQLIEKSKDTSIQEVEKPGQLTMVTRNHKIVHVVEVPEKTTRSTPILASVTPTPSSKYRANTNRTADLQKLPSVSTPLDSLLDSKRSPSVRAAAVSFVQGRSTAHHVWQPTSPETTRLDTRNTEKPTSHSGEKNDQNDSKHARRHIGNRIMEKGHAKASVQYKSSVTNNTVIGKESNGYATDNSLSSEKSTEVRGTVKDNQSRARHSSRPYLLVTLLFAALVVLTAIGVLVYRQRKRRLNLTNGTQGHRPGCRPFSCDGGGSEAGSPENGVPNSLSNENSITSNPTLLTSISAEPRPPSLFQVFSIVRDIPCSGSNSPAGEELTFTTRATGTFNNTGGRLCTEDSDVSVVIPPGAIPEDVSQTIFFNVVLDERSLLRDIPETPEQTRISPVIECGPSDLNVLKPVKIVLPHCLYSEDIKKASVNVYRCGQFTDEGPVWERVLSAAEKTSQSMAWFKVKKDTIHIRTRCFSFWSVFACGGPKKKRAAVFSSKPSLECDTIYLRFYIYSDTEDSSRKVQSQDKQSFPDSKRITKEKPFKMFNDSKQIEVKLTHFEEGWILDKTPDSMVYTYQSAYRNGGFRARDSCDFAVKPTRADVQPFSCMLNFQQEDHPPEQTIYLNTGMKPQCGCQNNNTESSVTSAGETSHTEPASDNSGNSNWDAQKCVSKEPAAPRVRFQLDFPPEISDEPVTQRHCICIQEKVGVDWKKLLRELGIDEAVIKIVDTEHGEVTEKCYQGLIRWKECHGSDATTRKLCGALHRINSSEAIIALRDQGVRLEPCTAVLESSTGPGPCV